MLVVIAERKLAISSGLCIWPRVHATFKLFTLGFVVTLLEMKKEKKKNSSTNCSGGKNNYASDSGLSTRNI